MTDFTVIFNPVAKQWLVCEFPVKYYTRGLTFNEAVELKDKIEAALSPTPPKPEQPSKKYKAKPAIEIIKRKRRAD